MEDTGIGVRYESQNKIFDAFKQQDGQSTRKYGGTGLGLTITKKLLEMMDGEINLRSEPGKGSVFEIILHNVSVSSTLPQVQEDKLLRTGQYGFRIRYHFGRG
ncbi:MAG: hypothetical protein HC887_00695 [Desulfobacteraceae bacterium]|nr:hypothetical protein [Desulfobacteraceae bacterium]